MHGVTLFRLIRCTIRDRVEGETSTTPGQMELPTDCSSRREATKPKKEREQPTTQAAVVVLQETITHLTAVSHQEVMTITTRQIMMMITMPTKMIARRNNELLTTSLPTEAHCYESYIKQFLCRPTPNFNNPALLICNIDRKLERDLFLKTSGKCL